MGSRILITRPEPGTSSTGKRIAAMGFDPLLLPLSRIEPIEEFKLPIDGNTAAIALTSANAVRHVADDRIKSIADLPVYAVGPSTAAQARDRGLQVEWVGEGRVDLLAGEVANRLGPGQTILYLTGRVRRPDFEQLLAATGVTVDVAETYNAALVSYTTNNITDLLSHTPVDAVLVYSAIAAESLLQLTRDTELRHLFESAWFICLSERIAEALAGAGEARITVANVPTEAAMLDILYGGNFSRS